MGGGPFPRVVPLYRPCKSISKTSSILKAKCLRGFDEGFPSEEKKGCITIKTMCVSAITLTEFISSPVTITAIAITFTEITITFTDIITSFSTAIITTITEITITAVTFTELTLSANITPVITEIITPVIITAIITPVIITAIVTKSSAVTF
ncbi:hypothetical protein EMCRGX_G002281 [Ephydatia muelleri]